MKRLLILLLLVLLPVGQAAVASHDSGECIREPIELVTTEDECGFSLSCPAGSQPCRWFGDVVGGGVGLITVRALINGVEFVSCSAVLTCENRSELFWNPGTSGAVVCRASGPAVVGNYSCVFRVIDH